MTSPKVKPPRAAAAGKPKGQLLRGLAAEALRQIVEASKKPQLAVNSFEIFTSSAFSSERLLTFAAARLEGQPRSWANFTDSIGAHVENALDRIASRYDIEFIFLRRGGHHAKSSRILKKRRHGPRRN